MAAFNEGYTKGVGDLELSFIPVRNLKVRPKSYGYEEALDLTGKCELRAFVDKHSIRKHKPYLSVCQKGALT